MVGIVRRIGLALGGVGAAARAGCASDGTSVSGPGSLSAGGLAGEGASSCAQRAVAPVKATRTTIDTETARTTPGARKHPARIVNPPAWLCLSPTRGPVFPPASPALRAGWDRRDSTPRTPPARQDSHPSARPKRSEASFSGIAAVACQPKLSNADGPTKARDVRPGHWSGPLW